MPTNIPYTFAGDTGNIPLSQLDENFANVKAFAETAGYVTEPAQANITSVGTLTSLSVSGTVTAAQVSAVGNVYANIHTGNTVSVTGNITGGNISVGNVITANTSTSNTINATFINATTIAGTLTTAAQGNITSVGSLTSLSVVGNTTSGNLSTAQVTTTSDVSIGGNLVVTGNATVNGTTTTINVQTLNITDKDVVVANNVATSSLINGAGIVAGNPTVSSLIYSHANLGWGTANNFNVGGNLTVTGAGFATTPSNTTSNTQIATTAFVRNIIPSGVITLWYGSVVSVPAGWYLCDGSNGTPDLRNRFIVGAGSTYSVGGTGGSADAVVVSHTHTANSVVTDPGHTHVVTADPGTGTSGAFGGGVSQSATAITSTSNVTGITVATTVNSSGVSGTNANLPPYYALCYIMKA